MLGNSKYGYMDVWCNITATTRAAANASTSTSAAAVDAGALRAESGPNHCRAFRLRLVAELSDGTVVSHVSGQEGWAGRRGPIVNDHMYHGETVIHERTDWWQVDRDSWLTRSGISVARPWVRVR